MKRTFDIEKSRLYASKDYTQLLQGKQYEGFTLAYKELEPIVIESKTVCFFDAYSNSITKPYLQEFNESNATPFCLRMLQEDKPERIALAGLRFSTNVATEWKIALYEERDVIKLSTEAEYPISTMIHSGFIAFADNNIAQKYPILMQDNEGVHALDFAVSFDGNTALRYEIEPKKDKAKSIAVFSTGNGDGVYPTYIGYDKDRNPTAILCDFLLFNPKNKLTYTGVESFEFEMKIEDLYFFDPSISSFENNIAKWTFVLSHKDELDDFQCYRAYASRAHAYHSVRQFSQALEDYYVAIDLAEKLSKEKNHKLREWTLYDNAGQIQRKNGNLDEAKKLFEKSKKFDDSFSSTAFVNLVEIYMREANYEQAKKIAGEMIELRPQDPISYLKMAEVCIASDKIDEAISIYDVLIKKFDWDEAIMDKTMCLGTLGRYDEALNTLETYLNENEPNEVYYYNKGFMKLKQGKMDEAYLCMLNAFEFHNEFTLALNRLIEMDELYFDYENVVRWATKYIEIHPDAEYGLSVRAEGYMFSGNYQAALKDYHKIIEKISHDPIYIKQAIYICLLMGNAREAKKYLKRYKKRGGKGWLALYHALIWEKQNKAYAAKKIYDQFLEKGTHEQFLHHACIFYIRHKEKERAKRALERLVQFGNTDFALLRKINFERAFGTEESLHKLIDEYIAEVIPELTKEEYESERNNVKTRALNAANVYK